MSVPAARTRRALRGDRIDLGEYAAECVENSQFRHVPGIPTGRMFLPPTVGSLLDASPTGSRTFVEDDNRGAVLPDSICTIDGRPFYLSVKGIGSTTDPYAHRRLDRSTVESLCEDEGVRQRIRRAPTTGEERWITGELWLSGSPYGGQGLAHASTALALSERADVTSIAGFRIAPVVAIASLPPVLEESLRSIHWFRRYRGRFVQEIRLVPSNVRIYFHARSTVGHGARDVFTTFGIDDDRAAISFERELLRTGFPLLTLLARTARGTDRPGEIRGLDFHDVWLDKDAVLAPDGSIFFVDLEGIEEVVVPESELADRIADQYYRSLYELTFAFEQIDAERERRFGGAPSRKGHYLGIVRDALRSDPFVRLRDAPSGASLEVRTPLSKEPLNIDLPVVDR